MIEHCAANTAHDDDLAETGTAADAVRELLADDKLAYSYLLTNFIASAMLGLSAARQAAGMTQREVAEKMQTHQSAVARWESDMSGKMSLLNYVRFAHTVGKQPFNLALEDIECIRQFALAVPEQEITEPAYAAWSKFEKWRASLEQAPLWFSASQEHTVPALQTRRDWLAKAMQGLAASLSQGVERTLLVSSQFDRKEATGSGVRIATSAVLPNDAEQQDVESRPGRLREMVAA